jgi:ADP-ribosylglycohydrolase
MDANATLLERTRAALWGVAVGDAFGKMTEGYWPNQIDLRYGGHLDEFRMPIPANPDHVEYWSFAEVTDDTLLTILTAESIWNERVVKGFSNSHCSEATKVGLVGTVRSTHAL